MSDDSLRRRDLLQRASLLGAAALAAPMAACSEDDDTPPVPTGPLVFLHGVASGDPLPDAIILWTHVTSPDGADVAVDYALATDPEMADMVMEGSAQATAAAGHTVKLDITGLSAGTTYYYQFSALDEQSAIGRTRTADSGQVERVKLAVCSCAAYGHGYFNAYRQIANRADLSLVVHLGDYIYEYETGRYGDTRDVDPPHETVTLDDYRRRYAHYRKDADLQAVHQQHPFVTVWDDHELANNAWVGGAGNHNADEGDWETRKAAAQQAYFEWMPVREQQDGNLWRVLRYGDLLDLHMLDTRVWGREQQAADGDDPIIGDSERTLLGDDQETWLYEQLGASTAQWKLVGQQVMMGQLPQFLNVDQWDGYPAARQRLFDAIITNAVQNFVVLTGDIHCSWAMDLTSNPFGGSYDPTTGTGSLGVELVTPGVTSPGFGPEVAFLADGLIEDNPHLFFAELTRRGYIVVDIDSQRLEASWYYIDDIETQNDTEMLGGVVTTQSEANHIQVQSSGS